MELSETIELMQSEDFRERFKAEYLQTKIRHDKLAEMVKKYEAGTLDFKPKCGLSILKAQLYYMERYIWVLKERAKLEEVEL